MYQKKNDRINNEEHKLIKEEFKFENKSPNISFIQYDETFMNVPLLLFAVSFDPLDVTQEFTTISNSISY